MSKWKTVALASVILATGLLSTLVHARTKLVTREIHIGTMEPVDPADMLDAEERGKYDWIMSGTPILSPDKKRMVYVATRDGSTFAVVDGVEQKAYYDIGTPPIFSPDSKRVAYAAIRNDRWVIVVDGAEGREYDQIIQPLVFSPDSMRVVYAASRDDRQFAVVNGVEQKEYKRVYDIEFGPDGQRLAYIARKNNDKSAVVVDEVEVKEHDNVANYIFSPNSRRVAYVAVDSKKLVIVADGVAGKERYDRIYDMVFSPDSKRLAYMGVRNDRDFLGLAGGIYRLKRGDKMIPVLKEEIQEKEQYSRTYGLTFSSDSKRLVYAAIRDRRHFVVVDGIEQEKYDGVGLPAFSPDSKHIVYCAGREGRWFLVVDGAEWLEYDEILSVFVYSFGDLDRANGPLVPRRASFDPEDPAKFHTEVIRDQDIFRLEVEIVEE